MRIEYQKRNKGEKWEWIPPHKQWIQLFKRDTVNDKKEIVEEEERIIDYAYDMKQIPWRDEFDIGPTYDQEGNLIRKGYIEEHWNEIWEGAA